MKFLMSAIRIVVGVVLVLATIIGAAALGGWLNRISHSDLPGIIIGITLGGGFCLYIWQRHFREAAEVIGKFDKKAGKQLRFDSYKLIVPFAFALAVDVVCAAMGLRGVLLYTFMISSAVIALLVAVILLNYEPMVFFTPKFVHDAQLMAIYQQQRKHRSLSAILNVIIPGAGQFYCGRLLSAVITFMVTAFLVFISSGILAILLAPLLLMDGVACATRHNRKLAEQIGPLSYRNEAMDALVRATAAESPRRGRKTASRRGSPHQSA